MSPGPPQENPHSFAPGCKVLLRCLSPLLPEGLGFGIGVGAMKCVVGLPFAVIGIVTQWRSILGRLASASVPPLAHSLFG